MKKEGTCSLCGGTGVVTSNSEEKHAGVEAGGRPCTCTKQVKGRRWPPANEVVIRVAGTGTVSVPVTVR